MTNPKCEKCSNGNVYAGRDASHILKPCPYCQPQQEPMNQDNQVDAWLGDFCKLMAYHRISVPEAGWHALLKLICRVAKDSYAKGIRRAGEKMKEAVKEVVCQQRLSQCQCDDHTLQNAVLGTIDILEKEEVKK